MLLIRVFLAALLLLTPLKVVSAKVPAKPLASTPIKIKASVVEIIPATLTPVKDVSTLIREYSALYGIDSTIPLRIAYAESGYRCNAQNAHSSAGGVYQFLNGTFLSTQKQM